MIWIVLRSASAPEGGISSDMAVQLLENLFEACSMYRAGSLRVSDPMLVWELYNLVEYSPPKEQLVDPRSDDEDEVSDAEMNGTPAAGIPK